MRKLLLATTALLALAAAPAKADTYDATGVSVLNGINVTIDTPKFENVQSGEIHLTGPSGVENVWCLDVFDGINLPYTYTINTYHPGDVFAGMAVLDAAQVRQISALMFLGNAANTGPFADAVLQLAIWSVEYGGAFTYSGTDSATRNSVNTAILDTDNGGLFDRADLDPDGVHRRPDQSVAGVRSGHAGGSRSGALDLGDDAPRLCRHRRHGGAQSPP